MTEIVNICHPYSSKKEYNMTSNTSLRRTEIWVASLWIVTAIGAIAGAVLINPIISAPDYLTTVFPKSATVVIGMLLWLVNNIGIVFIGLLMFPILKKQSESMALGYVSMRIFESLLMTVGVAFAVLLIPLSQAFIKAGATDITTYQVIGASLKQVESLFLNLMQLLFLGLGGLILTTMLYRSKLVPRWISVIGIIGYALLLPAFALALFGVFDPTPGAGGSGSLLAVPVAIWEIIIMPIWLFAKGFNTASISAEHPASSEKMEVQPIRL
jgi:hypothetical protein